MGRILRALAASDPLDSVLRLTLLTFLLQPIGDRTVRPGLLILAAAGLLLPSLLRRPALWAGLTALTAWRVLADWPLSDNHAYLLCYWCLAACVSLIAADPAASLARNARWLLAGVFGFSIVWKLGLAADFADGTFLRVTMLEDPRFEAFTRRVAAVPADLLEEARVALFQHVDGPIAELAVPELSSRFHRVAAAVTLWTAGIELLLMIALLWPGPAGVARLRDGALIVFCATTYAVADVPGFGWLLVTLGLAQCSLKRTRTRALYLLLFPLILVYSQLPWAHWLLR